MLISEASAMWLRQRRVETLSEHTLRAYRLQMDLLMRSIGDIEVERVTLAVLREYIGGPDCEHLKPSSLAHRVRTLKSFCRWLYEEEHVARDPSLKLREPKQPRLMPKAIAFEDLELLRDACRNAREHALIEFLFATGCRASEICAIQRGDLDWNRRAVVVLGKGSKEREVYFGARAALWLSRYLKERQDDCPYLFVTERRPYRQFCTHQLWYIVKQVADRVGLRERVWPHVMRHTLATTLLNQGADLVVVQTLLGHERPETTQRYAVLSGANRQAAYQRYFVQ